MTELPFVADCAKNRYADNPDHAVVDSTSANGP